MAIRPSGKGIGRGRRIDETGNVYGRLTVLGPAPKRDASAIWECQCECGSLTNIRGFTLREGALSCGCLRRENFKPKTLAHGEACRNRVIANTISNAKRRGLAWELSIEQVTALLTKDCQYCGSPPGQVSRGRGHNGEFIYNGLDRVDNALGYAPDNVVACCGVCNTAKSNMTMLEFSAWLRRVYVRLNGELQ